MSPKHYQLKDLIVPGNPILVTAVSSNAARTTVLETCWEINEEPHLIDAEFMDPSSLDTEWKTLKAGGVILITEASRADEETQRAILEKMKDPDKRVVVAENKVPSFMPPESFSHYAKF